MPRWSWRRVNVTPEDILSAARTLEVQSSWFEIDSVSHWRSSAVYLKWAQDCLPQNTAFGLDAALCYAKRAVCREIDAFMTCNHFGSFLGDTYPAKIKMLRDVGLRIPDVIHQLIIDPRNESEHSYTVSAFGDVKKAVELAELFLMATTDEQKHHAIISIGWSIDIRQAKCAIPGKEYERLDFTLSDQSAPMLLIDVCADEHHAIILHPKDKEVSACSLREFKREQILDLARLLRRYYAFQQTGNWSCALNKCDWLLKLKADIDLFGMFP